MAHPRKRNEAEDRKRLRHTLKRLQLRRARKEAEMERLKGKETGQPQFDEDEVRMIRLAARRLKGLIERDLEAPTVNRESVLKFCDIVDRLHELARGDPKRLREYLEAQ